MDEMDIKEKPKAQNWTVAILDREFVVKAKNPQEARKAAAHAYRSSTNTNDPITFLMSMGRVRRHEDKRIKFNYATAVSVISLERERRKLMRQDLEEEVDDELEKPERISPTRW